MKDSHEESRNSEDYLKDDLDFEVAQFEKAIDELGLRPHLTKTEINQVFELWSEANANNFLMNVPLGSLGPVSELHERSTQRSEIFFTKLRTQLLNTPSWKSLPKEIQIGAEKRLFLVVVQDENLS